MNDIYIYVNLGDIGNTKDFSYFEILLQEKAIIVSKSIYMKHNSKVQNLFQKRKTTKKLSKIIIKKDKI